VALAGGLGLAGVLPSLFVVVSSLGLVLPNATTLALAGHPRTAGVAGATTALPMALVIAALGLAALASFALLSTAPVAAR
jgi:DHA1 family bicyclomycin/chloramphenicol resistance-like MFS transporter